jgi:hypothetical protein
LRSPSNRRSAPTSPIVDSVIVTDAAQKLALDSGQCVQILREAGHLDTTSTTGLSCVVDLGYIPDGLGAAELEQYLRGCTAKSRSAAILPEKLLPVSG